MVNLKRMKKNRNQVDFGNLQNQFSTDSVPDTRFLEQPIDNSSVTYHSTQENQASQEMKLEPINSHGTRKSSHSKGHVNYTLRRILICSPGVHNVQGACKQENQSCLNSGR